MPDTTAHSDADTDVGVLPAPLDLRVTGARRTVANHATIVVPGDAELRRHAEWFADRVARDFGVTIDVAGAASGDVLLEVQRTTEAGLAETLIGTRGHAQAAVWREGAYVLDTGPAARLVAADSAGVFYGLVTLWQLLSDDSGALHVPVAQVVDVPRFAWRGLMLDSARHVQSAEFVRQYIEWMALHKLNVLHWHLTDDQGWRLEIKSHPELTHIGAWRLPAHVPAGDMPAPARYGGYFSQDDVRDIVRYAADRHVTVVPEIDVPGHMTAAIAAHPALGIDGFRPTSVPANWGIYDNVLNLEDSTLRYFEDVLAEVMDLFPSRYIHLGGDEVVATQWQASERTAERMRELGLADMRAVQNYHFAVLQRFLADHGRRAIGWDEIVAGDIPAEAVVMSWRGVEGGIDAAGEGHDVVLSPAPTLYLDHLQTAEADAPPGRGGVITTQDVYAFDPLPADLRPYRDHVLGLQGNLWTEHVRREAQVEYMTWPRAAAIAELGWSAADTRSWPQFIDRLAGLFPRYAKLGINASDAPFAPDIRVAPGGQARDSALVTLANPSGFGTLRYTTDGSEPDVSSSAYAGPLALPLPVTVRARTYAGTVPVSRTRSKRIDSQSMHRREDRELELCSERIVLALEDDAPANGPRESYLVDIMDPCWIMRDVHTAGVDTLRAAVGQLPFNFEIGDAINDVVTRKPVTPAGELVVRADSCDGRMLASISLAAAGSSDASTVLPDTPLDLRADAPSRLDLCFYFTRTDIEPMWVIDYVQLLAGSRPGRDSPP